MKRIVLILCTMFCCVAAIAQTISIDWKIGNDIYSQSTCEYGGDLNVPATPPTKYGYTFQGWISYTQIEYLESTGTQWIDTGYSISPYTSNFKTNIKVSYLSLNTTRNSNPFAIGAVGLSGNLETYVRTGLMGGKFTYTITMNDAANYTANVQPIINNIYDIEMQYSTSNATLKVSNTNGTNIVNFSNNGNIKLPQRSIYLFGQNDVPGGTDGDRAIIGRIYSCKLYDNNTLVRDFIPVLDKDGIPCMYDKVEGKFYYNKGTGDFIAGPVI